MTKAEKARNELLAVVSIEELPEKEGIVAAILEWRDSQIRQQTAEKREAL